MTRATPVPDTVTIHVPFRLVKRGGRKEMQLPEGASTPRRPDDALVKALARAFRWKRMLDSGEFASISELAEMEGIAFTYMARLLRLTCWRKESFAVICIRCWKLISQAQHISVRLAFSAVICSMPSWRSKALRTAP